MVWLTHRTIVVIVTVMLAGCVTITPEAAKVQVHHQVSTLLDKCKRLGNIEASAPRVWGPEHARDNAKVKLREVVFARGGDTAAILNTDVYLTSVTVQGVAFKCD